MLNEMLVGRYICPVCERIIYGPLRGWWCPYCGRDLKENTAIEKTFTDRLTARAENGMPYYIGRFSFRERAFPQDLGVSAIAEILEKLAQFEDLAEEEAKNNDTPKEEEENNG